MLNRLNYETTIFDYDDSGFGCLYGKSSQNDIYGLCSDIATSEVELGVEGISRLCPTGLWDHWTFRDIMFDKESNSVVFVIQLCSWNGTRDDKEITEADAKKQTEWIVRNIMKGYDYLIKNPQM